MVRVCCNIEAVGGVFCTRIISGCSSISSFAARCLASASSSAPQRNSMWTLRPSVQPSFPERGQIIVKFWVALGMRHEYADASRSTGLLRLRRNWPCRRRAANDLDEIAPSHRLPRRLRTRHRSRLNYHTGRGRAWGVIHLSKGRPASRCLPQFEYTPHHWHACAANLGRDHPPSTLIGTCHEPARSPHFDALTDRLCKAQV